MATPTSTRSDSLTNSAMLLTEWTSRPEPMDNGTDGTDPLREFVAAAPNVACWLPPQPDSSSSKSSIALVVVPRRLRAKRELKELSVPRIDLPIIVTTPVSIGPILRHTTVAGEVMSETKAMAHLFANQRPPLRVAPRAAGDVWRIEINDHVPAITDPTIWPGCTIVQPGPGCRTIIVIYNIEIRGRHSGCVQGRHVRGVDGILGGRTQRRCRSRGSGSYGKDRWVSRRARGRRNHLSLGPAAPNWSRTTTPRCELMLFVTSYGVLTLAEGLLGEGRSRAARTAPGRGGHPRDRLRPPAARPPG